MNDFEQAKPRILNVVELARVPFEATDAGTMASSITKIVHGVGQEPGNVRNYGGDQREVSTYIQFVYF